MNKRMDRTKINIGTYILQPYARSEAHIKDLADAGVDFVIGMNYDVPALDLFQKYGVGAIVSGILPGWWGGDGHNAGKMAASNPLEKYDEAAAKFTDHPAIWGIDTGDEPSALDFPHYGKVVEKTTKLFPNQFAYLNLYPNYASVAKNTSEETVNQLGTATYAEHIDKYCEYVGLDYICYDFYVYSHKNENIDGKLENLRIVADACLRTGRSMWYVPQVNSLFPELWISENMLRFQAYSAMAYGAEVITWACWTGGWWTNQVLDTDGNKTEQYEKVKKINHEIKKIGEEYMKYRRVSTHLIGYADGDLPGLHQDHLDALNTGVFNDFKADGKIIAGQMVSRANDGSYALMVCATDDPYDRAPKTLNITFSAYGKKIRAIGGCGEIKVNELGDHKFSLELPSNAGVLIIAE